MNQWFLETLNSQHSHKPQRSSQEGLLANAKKSSAVAHKCGLVFVFWGKSCVCGPSGEAWPCASEADPGMEPAFCLGLNRLQRNARIGDVCFVCVSFEWRFCGCWVLSSVGDVCLREPNPPSSSRLSPSRRSSCNSSRSRSSRESVF